MTEQIMSVRADSNKIVINLFIFIFLDVSAITSVKWQIKLIIITLLERSTL